MGTEGSLSGIRRPESEADHLSISSTEVENEWNLYLHSPMGFMTWWLIKQWIRLHVVVLS